MRVALKSFVEKKRAHNHLWKICKSATQCSEGLYLHGNHLSVSKATLLCQIPVIKTGKNFVTFLYGNFLLRVLVNAVVWVFAIIIIGISTTALEFTIAVVVNSNNDYSKYPHYDIYQYSQREITV